MAALEGGKAQVKLQLSTRQPGIALSEDTGPILVETNLRRFALSTLVNHLLGTTASPIPFDFLINGNLLHTSLETFLNTHGISTETTLQAEYLPAFVPPRHVASFPHEAWVSSVDVLSSTSKLANANGAVEPGQAKILSASYDGILRVWSSTGSVLATSQPTGDGRYIPAVKAARFVSPSLIASGGFDRTVRLWRHRESARTLDLAAELHAHSAMVLGLDVHATEARLLSASADKTAALWSTDPDHAPKHSENTTSSSSLAGGSAAKRQRKSPSTINSNSSGGKAPKQLAPLATLAAHTDHVSAACFEPRYPDIAYSASLDGTLRIWNLASTSASVSSSATTTTTLTKPTDTRPLANPLLSLCCLTDFNLLAAGTSTGPVVLTDPRASAASVRAMTLRGHAGPVVGLAPDPGSRFRFVSGGFDGGIRVWDVRAGEGVQRIERRGGGHDEGRGREREKGEGWKVFGVAWDAEVGVVSGGEDRRVQVDR